MALVLALNVMFLAGCAKPRCQAPSTEPFSSITATEWRLAESNLLKPTLTTFTIWNFEKNFVGQIYPVNLNNRDESPSVTFEYNPDPEIDTIQMTYTDVSNPSDTKSTTYNYELGTELELFDAEGNYFRFVPFQGIVDPDFSCTF